MGHPFFVLPLKKTAGPSTPRCALAQDDGRFFVRVLLPFAFGSKMGPHFRAAACKKQTLPHLLRQGQDDKMRKAFSVRIWTGVSRTERPQFCGSCVIHINSFGIS
jgi:hypothetical protein